MLFQKKPRGQSSERVELTRTVLVSLASAQQGRYDDGSHPHQRNAPASRRAFHFEVRILISFDLQLGGDDCMAEPKVGDIVWYEVKNMTRERAEIIDITSKTHAMIRLITGSETGKEFEVPWGIIQPIGRSGE
jgi:hypothetical protein